MPAREGQLRARYRLLGSRHGLRQTPMTSAARVLLLCCIVLLVFQTSVWTPIAQARSPVARAVLFYSPTCTPCRPIVDEYLPPLVNRYGPRLQIVAVDVNKTKGDALFEAATEQYRVPEKHQGTPALVIGDHFIYGTKDIPAQFAHLVDEALARGGVGWPDIPGLANAIPPSLLENGPAGVIGASTASPDLLDRIGRDPLGNSLAIVVLVCMVSALGAVLMRFRHAKAPHRRRAALLALEVAVGLGIASYLAVMETAGVAVICGHLAHCDAVQQSSYARLFGFLPIGYLGVLGYGLLAFCLAVASLGAGRMRHLAETGLFTVALLGTLISIYLTALEPFVIGATCLWCLASSVIMTLALLESARSLTVRQLSLRRSAKRHGLGPAA